MNPQIAEQVLQSHGFNPAVAPTKKKSSWTAQGIASPVYVNLVAKGTTSVIILHPDFQRQASRLNQIPGVSVGSEFYHSSNMRLFPKRMHTGENLIPYGVPVNVADETAMGKLAAALKSDLKSA